MSTIIHLLDASTRPGECDGSAVFTAQLNAPAGRAKAVYEGGPWTAFWIMSGFGEDWATPSPTTDDFHYQLDDGASNKIMLGAWMRTAEFTKFNVFDTRGFAFSDVHLKVFLTNQPAFFAFYANDNTGVNGWF